MAMIGRKCFQQNMSAKWTYNDCIRLQVEEIVASTSIDANYIKLEPTNYQETRKGLIQQKFLINSQGKKCPIVYLVLSNCRILNY